MNLIKKHWKIILIVILFFAFLSKCSSSGNYERKYNKQVIKTEQVIDSMNNLYGDSKRHIDSLNVTIDGLKHQLNLFEIKLESAENQLQQAKEQNRQLANRKIVVDIKKDEE